MFEKGGGGHDLAGLAVAALRHVVLFPGFLHRVVAIFRKAFDGGDPGGAHAGNRQITGAHGHAVEVHGTGAALGDTAAVFDAEEVEVVAQDPQQGRVGIDLDGMGLAVDV